VIAKSLLEWLERDIPWRLHVGDFFEQYESNLLSFPMPNKMDMIFGDMLFQIRKRMEALFGTKLSEKITIDGHKLISGQGIGIHNDDPQPGSESYRLVVQLNRDFRDSYGGHLALFNSNSIQDIHRIVRPIHNSAIAFALLPHSWHAVSDVSEGERYSIVFSFWDI
jgi:Rps23 Pro-64 3,4-dihydroxylase Tpa1-like proline 4-hydroxylase